MKKLPLAKQRKVIQLFNNLFASGFHLTEIVSFLKRSQLLADAYTAEMEKGLRSGQSLASLLGRLGFADHVVTQVALSEVHGNTALSLSKIAAYLDHLSQVRRKLIEVGTYPLMLLGFLALMLLGLKTYLLPQIEASHPATLLMSYLPQLFLASLCLLTVLILFLIKSYRSLSKIQAFSFLSRVPFLGGLVKLYLTAYYARAWGNLIGQGLELSAILQMMQTQADPLFRELGTDLSQALASGQGFAQKIGSYPFFRKELCLMIEYGEMKGKLGQELEIYAEETWTQFFTKINQAMQLIQPLVFVFVALMIVLIYAAMLLPIYHNLEVSL